MRFHFDEQKSERLRDSDLPEQYRAIGWVREQLREDEEGEYYHLVTLWRASKQEQQLYAEHS